MTLDNETRYNSLTNNLHQASHAQNNARRTAVRPEDQVDQYDLFTCEVVKRWDSAAAAAASLGLPVHEVKYAAMRGHVVAGTSRVCAMFSWAMPHGRTLQTHPVFRAR